MKTKRWVMSFLLLGCVGLADPGLRAQAIMAPSGRTLFSGATLVRSFAQVNHFALRSDGDSKEITQYITPLAVVYGFHPKWTVVVAQPYVTVDITSHRGDETRRENINGLGDSQMFIQYDGIYSRNTPGGLTRLSGILGLQAPTGARRFSTGAFEYTGGLIFEKQANLKYVFTADFEYTFATENDRGLTVGDRARFDAVPGYFVISREKPLPDASWLRKVYDRAFRDGAYFILEFNGAWQAHARSQGTGVANSGGTTLSISPGIQYFPGRSFLIEFSYAIPVARELNGTQPELESTFLFGFRYLF
ncbi:MAG: transporter [Acidobacteria bacterium]|nr:transporter [Acidobacteriota bacterium]